MFQTFKTDVTSYVTQQIHNQHPSIDASDSGKSTCKSDNNNSETIIGLDNNVGNQNENGLLNLLREKEDLDVEDEDSDKSVNDMNPLDNFITTGDMNNLNDKDIIPESIPTTNAGDLAFTIEENVPKGQYINSHVILNQFGSI